MSLWRRDRYKTTINGRYWQQSLPKQFCVCVVPGIGMAYNSVIPFAAEACALSARHRILFVCNPSDSLESLPEAIRTSAAKYKLSITRYGRGLGSRGKSMTACMLLPTICKTRCGWAACSKTIASWKAWPMRWRSSMAS